MENSLLSMENFCSQRIGEKGMDNTLMREGYLSTKDCHHNVKDFENLTCQ